MANNAKKVSFTSARGTAVYPYLQPGRPDTQFDANGGHYKVQLKVSADDAKPLMDMAREAAQEEFGKKASSASMPWKAEKLTVASCSPSKAAISHAIAMRLASLLPKHKCQLSTVARH